MDISDVSLLAKLVIQKPWFQTAGKAGTACNGFLTTNQKFEEAVKLPKLDMLCLVSMVQWWLTVTSAAVRIESVAAPAAALVASGVVFTPVTAAGLAADTLVAVCGGRAESALDGSRLSGV